MLENVAITANELKRKPTTTCTFKGSVCHSPAYIYAQLCTEHQQVHEPPDLETVEVEKLSVETIAKNMKKITDVNMTSWL